MRKEIDVRKIEEKIYKSEQIEDWDDFESYVTEADGTNALEFFGITFDRDSHILSIPETFDADKASKIVSCYLAFVEEDFDTVNEYPITVQAQAREYDEYTRDSRGADDGTFDYAGTYVISILDIIKQVR